MLLRTLKTAVFAWLCGVGLVFADAEPPPKKHAFPAVIEGSNCQVTVYQPSSPLAFAPMVEKGRLPESQLMVALMLTNSDISSYMSDEEIAAFSPSKPTGEEIQAFRASMKKRFEVTGSTAEDNPWKGMKYVVDQVFVVECGQGKFLVYQFSTQGGEVKGKLFGSLRQAAGRWLHGGSKEKSDQQFQKSLVSLIPEEFTKRKDSAGIKVLPLEVLLK